MKDIQAKNFRPQKNGGVLFDFIVTQEINKQLRQDAKQKKITVQKLVVNIIDSFIKRELKESVVKRIRGRNEQETNNS